MSLELDAPPTIALRAYGVEPDSELGAFVRSLGGHSESALDFAPVAPVGHTDVLLFRGDTYSVLSRLLAAKENRRWRTTPMLAVLTDGDAKQRAACKRAGALQCFGEPVPLSRLRASLEIARAHGLDSEAPPDPDAALRMRELVLTVRTVADAEAAARFLAGFCPRPTRQGLGLAELFINAVEHGNLELDGAQKRELLRQGGYAEEIAARARDPRFAEREVTIWLRRFTTHVEIACEDQGPGFDWQRLGMVDVAAHDGPSGRGIGLARTLAFDAVEYVGAGNVVVARANFASHGASSREYEAISSWERGAIERRVDRLEERALDPDFFDGALALALDVSDAALGCLTAVDRTGNFTVLASRCPPDVQDAARRALECKSCPDRAFARVLATGVTAIENEPHRLCESDLELSRSLLVPIVYASERVGLLLVADKDAPFTQRDAQRLQAVSHRLGPLLAARMSAALAARRSAELERAWAKTREEQEIAQHLVARMLRDGCLDGPDIRHSVTAKEVFSGDLALAARLPSGGLRWMLGDFVGHGLPAAIGGLPLASVFYTTTKKGVPLRDVVSTMNERLLVTLPRGFFCAAILLELEEGKLRYWNGGMPAGCVRRAGSREVDELPAYDIALGVAPSTELALGIGVLEVGALDHVFCYSDGLIETCSPSGELFGSVRAARVLADAPPADGFERLLAALTAFRGSAETVDDISLISVAGKAGRET